eukprot:CFRG4792T1
MLTTHTITRIIKEGLLNFNLMMAREGSSTTDGKRPFTGCEAVQAIDFSAFKRSKTYDLVDENKQWSADPSKDLLTKMIKESNIMQDNELDKDFIVSCQLPQSTNVKQEEFMFHCHKLILRLVSSRLSAEIRACEGKGMIKLNCSQSAGRIFVDFCYLGRDIFDEIKPSNVFEVLAIARRFNIRSLQDMCQQYLRNNCLSRCLALLAFSPSSEAEMFMIKAKQSFRYLVKAPEDASNLPVDTFINVMTDCQLNTDSEDMVFRTVVTWLKKNNDDESLAEKMLEDCVRFERLLVEGNSSQVSFYKNQMKDICPHSVERLWNVAYSNLLALQREPWNMEVMEPMVPRIPYGVIQMTITDFPDEPTVTVEWTGEPQVALGRKWRIVAKCEVNKGFFSSKPAEIQASAQLLHETEMDRYSHDDSSWPYFVDYRIHDLQDPAGTIRMDCTSTPGMSVVANVSKLKDHRHINNGHLVIAATIRTA